MKQKNPLVSIIIVNWNGLSILQDCLKSLSKIDYKNTEWIIVDNGSEDGSLQFVKKNYPKTKLIENKKNLGFAKANNIGYEKSTGKIIVFLNNDTTVAKDFLNKLVDFLQTTPDAGLVQPKILLLRDHTKIDSIGSYYTNTGFLYHYGYYKNGNNKLFNKKSTIYTAKGACMVVKREVLEKVGCFDDTYFAYFEETDLCHRIWLSGYKVYYLPNVEIYHKGGETSNRLASSFVQYHSYKNRIATYIKNLGIRELLKIMPLHIVMCEMSALMFLLRGQYNIFIAIQRGLWWNISNFGQLHRKRHDVQSHIRKVSDKLFISKISRKTDFTYFYYLFTGLDKMPESYYEK